MYADNPDLLLNLAAAPTSIDGSERDARMRGVLSELSLREENALHAYTLGIGANRSELGVVPGYLNCVAGKRTIARFADGQGAPVHVLDGLPDDWIAERDCHGRPVRTHPGIVASFSHGGPFLTRDEAAEAAVH